MKLGFAGLGLMGAPMAINLLSAWPELIVYNRSAPALDRLRSAGARGHTLPDPFFAMCDAVILMLANDAATDAVLGRGSTKFARRVSGKLIVNMGTHAPDWSAALEHDVRSVGGRFVEAPVSGSRGPAAAATLVVMAAGEENAVRDALPLLAPMCREVVATGLVPSAMACKLAVNLYLIVSVAALAEAAVLSNRLGLAPHVFEQVVGNGPLGSEVSRAKLAKMMTRDFAPQAAIRDVCKNAALVASAATSADLDTPLLATARQAFEAVRATGDGELDMAAVVTTFDSGRVG